MHPSILSLPRPSHSPPGCEIAALWFPIPTCGSCRTQMLPVPPAGLPGQHWHCSWHTTAALLRGPTTLPTQLWLLMGVSHSLSSRHGAAAGLGAFMSRAALKTLLFRSEIAAAQVPRKQVEISPTSLLVLVRIQPQTPCQFSPILFRRLCCKLPRGFVC